MNVYQAVYLATQRAKKKKSAETRAIKKQGISTNTDHVFSSSTQWFYKA